MEHILIIGATGQIGSELTMELRKRYGNANVVAGYIPGAEPKGELKESGPSAIADVTDGEAIASVVKEYHIDTIYNLAALLSVVAESKPKLAWKIGIDGLWNVLEVAREQGCAVFTPSSIGSFGASTPHTKTPQDTIQRPRTMYGVTKVTTELLSDYYFNKYGVDTRAVRFPGIISNVTPPGGGTTDYAVDIYYSAVKDSSVCRTFLYYICTNHRFSRSIRHPSFYFNGLLLYHCCRVGRRISGKRNTTNQRCQAEPCDKYCFSGF